VFAKITGPLSHRRWLSALKAGRTFATNGPLLGFTLNGKEVGSELTLPAGAGDIVARVRLNSIVPVDHLEIVRNGEVVAEVTLPGNRTTVSASVPVPALESGWYLLRARGNGPSYPVLDSYPYATTSPIYVTVGGQPIRSLADADYFVAWIGRLEAVAWAYKDWNTEAERSNTLESLQRAKAIFQARRSR
jgi:TolB protein